MRRRMIATVFAWLLALAACDNVATWSESAAADAVREQLGPDVRLHGLRYIRTGGEPHVCGQAARRRFVWRGDYRDAGGDLTFFDAPTEVARWEQLCDV